MVDKFSDPLLTPKDVARHLRIPESTMYYWLGGEADGERLVHRVAPEKRGWPSVPFVAVVEAYVLRSLRDLGLKKGAIRDAAAEVRRAFKTPYALATQKITTDGVDIFVHCADGELARVGDRQQPFREVIDDHLHYINWDATDGFAGSLRLRQYPDVAPVIIDPRFGWGRRSSSRPRRRSTPWLTSGSPASRSGTSRTSTTCPGIRSRQFVVPPLAQPEFFLDGV